jgi:hypothetical protein
MIPTNRRRFCACLTCALVFNSASKAADRRLRDSCNLSFDATGDVLDKTTIRRLSFERDDFANALVVVLEDLSKFLGVRFDFGLYDDGTRPNAAFSADPTIRPAAWSLPAAPDGVILLGTSLVAELRRLFVDLSAPLTALCAHEAGHALQKKHKLDDWRAYSVGDDDERYQDRYELCADFICGFYGAHRQHASPSYPAAIQAVTQFSKGDNLPMGHGTPDQRAKAVEAGFRLGKRNMIDGKKAVEAGHAYALSVQF